MIRIPKKKPHKDTCAKNTNTHTGMVELCSFQGEEEGISETIRSRDMGASREG